MWVNNLLDRPLLLCGQQKKYFTHCVKRVRIRSYYGPYFPAFALNTERYGVSLRDQSECWKIQTRITSNKDILYAVKVPSFSKDKKKYLKKKLTCKAFRGSIRLNCFANLELWETEDFWKGIMKLYECKTEKCLR